MVEAVPRAVILVLCWFATGAGSTTSPSAAVSDGGAPTGAEALATLRARLAQVPEWGWEAGSLHEREAELLEGMGSVPEAIQAYEAAARAYERSPEGSDMPRIRGDRARLRAESLRISEDGATPLSQGHVQARRSRHRASAAGCPAAGSREVTA